jgi:hypothetical protein
MCDALLFRQLQEIKIAASQVRQGNDGDGCRLQQFCGIRTRVADNDIEVGVDQNGHIEPKRANALGHLVNLFLRMGPWFEGFALRVPILRNSIARGDFSL